MNVTSIYFSPTGGTKKVSDIFCNAFEYETEEIDLCESQQNFQRTFTANDLCFIAVPSYGGRVPSIAIERLQKMQGNGCKAILVVVYGNRAYEDTLLELQNTMDHAGFICIGAVCAIAQHSIMHCFASDRPDVADKQQLQAFATRMKESLLSTGGQKPLVIPGNEPYKEYHGVPLKPSTDKNCIACGQCAVQCPVQAIDPLAPNSTNSELCISCMRCIGVCPAHARKLNKLLLMGATKALKKACASRKENEIFLGE